MYDPTLKYLIDHAEADWARFLTRTLGLPDSPYTNESTNLPAGPLDADRVFRFELPEPYLINLEIESGRPADRPSRFLNYSTRLTEKTGLPVLTAVVLLRKEADNPAMSGRYTRQGPKGVYLQFDFSVIRLWQLPTAIFFEPGSRLFPLAALTADEQEIAGVVERVRQRIQPMEQSDQQDIWNSLNVLMGLRFEATMIESLLKGVINMEDSVTYQEIIRKGRRNELKGMIQEAGLLKLGEMSSKQLAKLENIMELELLRKVMINVVVKQNWDDVLQT
jgi:predicted transposase YdaD